MTDPAPSPLRFQFDVSIPMRDGIRTSADIFFPNQEGRYPAVLLRTCYDNTSERHLGFARYFAEHGYVFVFQDVRGRGDSDGVFVPFENEGLDGYDTVEWIASQPWCTGKVGTVGGSYLGTAQWLAARERPPHLTAMVSSAPAGRWMEELPYHRGKLLLQMLMWLNSVAGRTNQPTLTTPSMAECMDWQGLMGHTPLLTADELIGRSDGMWRKWVKADFANYWSRLSLNGCFEKIDLPVLHITGWFDGDQPGALYYYKGMTSQSPAADRQFILAGPWQHSGVWFPQQKLGDLDFGESSVHDAKALQVRWFDFWLKGEQNGLLEEPRVKVFVMGRNRWREASAWPIPGTQPTNYYLHSRGQANTLTGDGWLDESTPSNEPADHYTYDPMDTCTLNDGIDDNVTFERRPVEERQEVLVYTSQPLQEDLELTGTPTVVLHAASDAPDTDFAAVLVDVHPDGRAVPVAEGILRASYRHSVDGGDPPPPGEACEYLIELNAVSIAFLSGHSLRLEILSSYFPKYDRNPNSGDPPGEERSFQPAHQTIYHDRSYPSHLVLPVIPAVAASAIK
jgi:putative CocE/NonD family hydrolase